MTSSSRRAAACTAAHMVINGATVVGGGGASPAQAAPGPTVSCGATPSAGSVAAEVGTGHDVQPRGRGIGGNAVSTTDKHQLTLVTCTGKVTDSNGRFHDTKNLVVTATPIP